MSARARPRDTAWDVIVIGAGLGGLSAAAALARGGARVLVCEQHDVPGGYAHRFLRRPRGSDVVYSFDVALHQIGGLRPGRRIHRQLQQHGILERLQLRRFETVYRTRGPAHDLAVPADADLYQRALGELFPDHRAGIRDLFALLARSDLGEGAYDDPPAQALACLGRTLEQVVLAHVPDQRFLAVFSPLWAYLGLPPGQLCAFTFAQVWASFHRGGCFYVCGGGQALADAFVAVIEQHGGQVLLRAAVTRIDTHAGRVAGVQTARHGQLAAPVVVSNASSVQTLDRLLDAPALAMRDRLVSAEMPVSVSISECYVGLRGRAETLGLADRLLFDTPDYDLDAQWRAIQRGDGPGAPCVLANHNLSDPEHVPPGRSILNAAVLADGAGWIGLPEPEYRARKRDVERFLLDRLAAAIPDLRDRLEVCETGTPHTMARYSWNPAGAIYGVPASPRSHALRRARPRTAVAGLYLAGAWTFPVGGFEGAMTSGFHTARLVADDVIGRVGGGGLRPPEPERGGCGTLSGSRSS